MSERFFMEIIPASGAYRDSCEDDIPELVWATGPVSYEYHFADRDLFDAIVLGSWQRDGTLFAADTTSMAVEGDDLLGIEIGMPGPEYRARQNALGSVWQELVAQDLTDPDNISGVLERSEHASWLNPVIHEDTYYIHALSVKPGFRGKRVGYHLIQNAITKAREQGFAKLQLDVLSDNPAVEFYRAVGLVLLAETRAPDPSAFGVPSEYRMGMTLA
ncbi:MAG: GNAT family N-acetyltransferase [Pseudomonadota bacterium]